MPYPRSTKTTVRICAGLTLQPPEAPCRDQGRWFLVGNYPSDARPMYVCEAHLGWACARNGLPALISKDPHQ